MGVTLKDFARVIKTHIPNAQMEIGGGLNFYGFPYPATGVYDISRARDELGYKPEYDLEKGIADYLASLKRMKAATSGLVPGAPQRVRHGQTRTAASRHDGSRLR